VLPFGSALLGRRSRRHLRQSPDRDGKGSTQIDLSLMGLTSSGVSRSTASYKPEHHPVQSLSQPHDAEETPRAETPIRTRREES
jgi:hypothetical protein